MSLLEKNKYRVHEAFVNDVIDADTIEVTVDCSFNVVRSKVRIRLNRVYAPERNTTEGQTAKEFVNKLLNQKSIVIRSYKAKSFDRFIAEIFITKFDEQENRNCINDQIIKAGHALEMNVINVLNKKYSR